MGTTPKAILIGDIHYSLKTVSIADSALRMAIDKASELNVPVIEQGDLTNDKALLRAEVISALIKTGDYAADRGVCIFSIVGNHSLVNERSTNENALDFLRACENWSVIKSPISYRGFNFIPYQPSRALFLEALKIFPSGSSIHVHQGLTKAWPGEYCFDHSAVHPDDVSDYRILSSHYHRAQDIKCGRPRKGAVGLWSYIGSPYTTSFAEANDGPKGFQILYDDGSLEQVRTDLRKHVIAEVEAKHLSEWLLVWEHLHPNPEDLFWLKIKGTTSELANFTKESVGKQLLVPSFRLDFVPTDSPPPVIQNIEKKSGVEIMDELIASADESDTQKQELKQLVREIMG